MLMGNNANVFLTSRMQIIQISMPGWVISKLTKVYAGPVLDKEKNGSGYW